MNELWRKSKYLSRTDFIIGNQIREYDIIQANISVLADQNIISESDYQYYASLPKFLRERSLGILRLKSKSVNDGISRGIEEAKKKFILNNHLTEDEILSINGDAIFVIGAKSINPHIASHTNFRLANTYTSYYNLKRIQMYYGYLPIENKEIFDVKGIDDKVLLLHQNYMISFLVELFYQAQSVGLSYAIKFLREFYMKYISLELDLGYYRRFDSKSMYDIKPFPGQEKTTLFQADVWMEQNKELIDISYNESILRDLQKIYAILIF